MPEAIKILIMVIGAVLLSFWFAFLEHIWGVGKIIKNIEARKAKLLADEIKNNDKDSEKNGNKNDSENPM